MTSDASAGHNILFEFIQSQTGIVLNDHRIVEINRYLERSAQGPDTLLKNLMQTSLDAPLWQDLLQLITVGETYFFRNQAHFNALRYQILPDLIGERRRANQKHLRLWSAGCATGEEPYSLAMLLREMLPDYQDWSIMILATDLNQRFIEQARRGVFTARSFRGETPDYIQSRWFTRHERTFELDLTIRQMVLFSTLNLRHNVYPGYSNNTTNLDLILCRNVTIYFDTHTTQSVVNRLHQALKPEGWLIVGHSEPQPGVYEAFKTHNLKNATCYQKPPMIAAIPASVPVRSPVSSARPLPPPAAAVPPPPFARSVPGAPVQPPAPPTNEPADEAVWAQAQAAANAGAWNEAAEYLAVLERRRIMRPQVHYLRALIQQHMEDWSAALWSLRQSIYCDPTFVMAYYMLGDLHARRGATREARRYWRQAQNLVADRDGDQPLIDDLSVDMLRDLLAYRLSAVSHE